MIKTKVTHLYSARRVTMTLSPLEAACLRKISEGPTILEACRSDVLEKLMQMGLVEHAPGLRYPLTSAYARLSSHREGVAHS